MTHKALIRQLQISCLGLDPIDPLRLLVDDVVEALAQPEQERFLVATIGNWGRVEWADGVFPSLGDKMYSAPRTWVGLTESERRLINFQWQDGNGTAPEIIDLVEAKLKEKNT